MATKQDLSQALEPSNGPGNGNNKPMTIVVREAIEQQSEAFNAVLPADTDPNRFTRLVLTAVKATPKLMQCFATPQGRTSVLLAAMQAAALGLEPNTPAEEAWLLPRDNKGPDGKKRTEAQLSVGYKGYLKLARQSGEVKMVTAHPVYDGDHFRYELGLHEILEHRPAPAGERGELVNAYAVAHYLNGGYNFVVLDEDDVHKRRASSPSWSNTRSRPYSPWTTNTAAMWRKSAIRELSHMMPRSPALIKAMSTDERSLEFDSDTQEITPTVNVPMLEEAGDDEVDETIDVEAVESDEGTVEVPVPSVDELIQLAKDARLIPKNAGLGTARKALFPIAEDATGRKFGDADQMATEVGPAVADYLKLADTKK